MHALRFRRSCKLRSRDSCQLGKKSSAMQKQIDLHKLGFPQQPSPLLPPGFLSLRKEDILPGLFPQTPVSGYYWLCSTDVAYKVVSPSCVRSSLSSCPFSWYSFCHSFSPSRYYVCGHVGCAPFCYVRLIVATCEPYSCPRLTAVHHDW